MKDQSIITSEFLSKLTNETINSANDATLLAQKQQINANGYKQSTNLKQNSRSFTANSSIISTNKTKNVSLIK